MRNPFVVFILASSSLAAGCGGPPAETARVASAQTVVSSCSDPRIQLWDQYHWQGNTVCLSGVGIFDLSTIKRRVCTPSGLCYQLPWAGAVRSWSSLRDDGWFTAQVGDLFGGQHFCQEPGCLDGGNADYWTSHAQWVTITAERPPLD